MASLDLNETVASFQTGARVWINASDLVRFTNYLKAWDADFKTAKRNSMVGAALRRAGYFILKVSKQNLRQRNNVVTGNLLHSFKVKVKRGSSGVLVGFGQGGHHAHLVDSGHEVVDNRSGKKVRTGKRTKGSYFHTDVRPHLPQAGAVFVATYERELLAHAQYWDSKGRSDIANKFR